MSEHTEIPGVVSDTVIRAGQVAMIAVMLWLYNTDNDVKFNAVYDTDYDRNNPYCREKLEVMRDGLKWFSDLDRKHQRRLIRAALTKYGEEASVRVSRG